jgi:membrane-bound lytic murein transglycosylase B
MVMMLGCAAGCVTTQQQRGETARREREIESLKADLYRLREQTGSASSGYEQIFADIARLRAERADGDKELAARLDELELQVRRQDAAIEAMRQQIVTELSQKMSTIIRSQKPARGAEYGREHEVKPGQTLSEIATAYGVSLPALVKANGLKDANSIRVGQKLFIPE